MNPKNTAREDRGYIRLNEYEKSILMFMASKNGLSMSEYLRSLFIQEYNKHEKLN